MLDENIEATREENSTSLIETESQPILDILEESSSPSGEIIGRFLKSLLIYSCAQNKPTFTLIMRQSWCLKP